MDGYTAMKYFQPMPQNVKVGENVYHFEPKKNISMAWVKDEHVNAVLSLVKVCCGGNKTHPYRLANDSDVRIWSGVSER